VNHRFRPDASVGGLIEAFEEVLDPGFHLRLLQGLGRLVKSMAPE
jgi:hypothetical protein